MTLDEKTNDSLLKKSFLSRTNDKISTLKYNTERRSPRFAKLKEFLGQIYEKKKTFNHSKISSPKNNENSGSQSNFLLSSISYSAKSKGGKNYEGKSKTNQDNYRIIPEYCGNPHAFFFGVFDGHGSQGHKISLFIKNNLSESIEGILINEFIDTLSYKDLEKIIQLGVKETMNRLMNSDLDYLDSGSTCNGILIIRKKLICFNIGDSRCVLGKMLNNGKWEAKSLSIDHHPSREDEKKRILNHGGRVKRLVDYNGNHVGPLRVWFAERESPGLAMTRSIGDTAAKKIGVVSTPEFSFNELTDEDKFIILASDGIWEFISNEEAVSIVLPHYSKNHASEGSESLVREALSRWKKKENGSVDDITCIIIFFNSSELGD